MLFPENFFMGISIIYINYNNFINSNEIHKTCTLPTFSKSYLRQAVWGLYIRELIHLKTTLQGKFKIFTTSRKRGI